MPEISSDATILLATSWQALKRAELRESDLEMTNCIVIIVFACFYIEAALNTILLELNKTSEMELFLGTDQPGLGQKMAWFYNAYVAREKALTKGEYKSKKIYQKVARKFPGFKAIWTFRNNISHGKVDTRYTNIKSASILRSQSKEVVIALVGIARKKGNFTPKSINYLEAIEKDN